MRAALVALLAVLAAGLAVRQAIVTGLPPQHSLAQRVWSGHPRSLTGRAMTEIGLAAARGEAPGPGTLVKLDEVARKAPLAPEPFLVAGTLAQVEGDQQRAERLFSAARQRDPRSEAARYFLADRYLRTGRVAPALREMAVFARLVPGGAPQFAASLAAYARTPGAVGQLRRFFADSPEFEPLVMSQLALDARNADLILALARPGATGAAPEWQGRIVNALVDAGDYAKAYAVWRRVSGVQARPDTLFNPAFQDIPAPPPFNWTLATSGGIAEAADGGLQVVYFGREDVVLAHQTLMLPPGRYQLRMDMRGGLGDGLIAWKLHCLGGGQPILTLKPGGSPLVQADFSVPGTCRAQRIELTGTAGEFPKTVEFRVDKLQLRRRPA